MTRKPWRDEDKITMPKKEKKLSLHAFNADALQNIALS